MADVTVRAVWSVLGLDEGVVSTIERTPRVDALIERGHLQVVLADGVPPEDGDLHVGDRIDTSLAVPPRNASRDDWATFLTALAQNAVTSDETATLEFTADDSRSDLISKYERWANESATDNGDADGSSGPAPVDD